MTTIDAIIPSDLPRPVDSGQNEDGRHDYEWYKDTDHILNLSTHTAVGKVIWAALIGNEDPRGSFLIGDGWPDYLTVIIRRITS